MTPYFASSGSQTPLAVDRRTLGTLILVRSIGTPPSVIAVPVKAAFQPDLSWLPGLIYGTVAGALRVGGSGSGKQVDSDFGEGRTHQADAVGWV